MYCCFIHQSKRGKQRFSMARMLIKVENVTAHSESRNMLKQFENLKHECRQNIKLLYSLLNYQVEEKMNFKIFLVENKIFSLELLSKLSSLKSKMGIVYYHDKSKYK